MSDDINQLKAKIRELETQLGRSDQLRGSDQARIRELETLLGKDVMEVVSRYDQLRNSDQENLFRLDMQAAQLKQEVASLERGIKDAEQRNKDLQDNNDHLLALLRSPAVAGPSEMVIRPNLPKKVLNVRSQFGFLIMPFRKEWSDAVHESVRHAHGDCGMKCRRADEQSGRHIVQNVIWPEICECGVVVADITEPNPNVMYELGLADAIGKKILLISQETDPAKIVFDLLGLQVIPYSLNELVALRKTLAEQIRNARAAGVHG